MTIEINLNQDNPTVCFKVHDQSYIIVIHHFNKMKQKQSDRLESICLSFDQSDAQGNVLKDGIAFEMELDINSWKDVAPMKATNIDLINAFLSQLGESEKSWLKSQYESVKQSLTD
jgi:hypothetical protein